MTAVQFPTIVLPQVAPLGTEVETIADAVVHTSLSFPVDSLQEKTVYVYATNPLGMAAPLQVWVELAPADVAAAYAPLAAPTILVVTGTAILQWTTHSSFARIRAQCPAWAVGGWALQCAFEAKTP